MVTSILKSAKTRMPHLFKKQKDPPKRMCRKEYLELIAWTA